MYRHHSPETKPIAAPIPFLGLLAFECVSRHLNFARAAEEMHVTPTAISKTVKQLEAQLSARLFNRTTRSVGLTESGEQLLIALAPALQAIRQSLSSITDASLRPSGTLRLNASFVASEVIIQPHLLAFTVHCPEVTLDLSIDNRLTDIVSQGFDAGIRLGHTLHRDMIAVPIGPLQQFVVVGAPEYFAKQAAPEVPEDLLKHQCIRQRMSPRGAPLEWTFRSGRKLVRIDVKGRLVFDEMRSALNAARQGCGLAYVFRSFATDDINSGRVVPVLEDRVPAGERFHVYFSNRTQMPGKLRAFIDFAKQSEERKLS